MQNRYRNAIRTTWIVAWVVVSLCLLLITQTSVYYAKASYSLSHEARGPDTMSSNLAGHPSSSNADEGNDTADQFDPSQPAISTLVISTQDVTPAPAIFEGGTEGPTTDTARIVVLSGSLLDRLTHNRPGIWGKKSFYVALGVIYTVLLALFLGIVYRLGRP